MTLPLLKFDMNPTESGQPSHRQAVFSVAALAMVLLAWKCLLALSDPSFSGDESIRLFYAWKPLFRLGNRVWLPFLQLHVWALYLLRSPSLYFHLIPCVYFFVAVVCYGLLALRLLGRTYSGLLLSLALMFLFAQNRSVSRLSVTLYQEIIGIAFLYALLYLGALTLHRSPVLLAIAAVSMLVRDTFAIYLFAFSLLNWKDIRNDGPIRRAVLSLWSVLALWYLSVPAGLLLRDRRLPRSVVEWPLMVNTEGGALGSADDGFAAIWRALLSTSALWPAAAVLAGWLIIRAARKEPAGEFLRRFAPFSLISLAITYMAVGLFNPWQATGGSGRIAAPLLEHLFIWALVVLAAAQQTTRWRGVMVRIVILGGLAACLNRDASAWLPGGDRQLPATYAKLEKAVYSSAPQGRPTVCFGPGEQFRLMDRLAAPTLYARHVLLQPGDSAAAACSVLIARPDALPPDLSGWEKSWEFSVEDDRFVLYRRVSRGGG